MSTPAQAERTVKPEISIQTGAASEKPTAPTPSSSPAKPGVKLGGIGFSWSNLRAKSKPSTKVNIIPGTVSSSIEQETDANFTQDDLDLQWMSMCVRMPQEYTGIATRMKNMNPKVIHVPDIEVVVDNTLIQQEMEEFKGRIISTLKNTLHNHNITLTIRVAKQKERVKILTRREQFELMREKNPAVEVLRQAFDLELA